VQEAVAFPGPSVIMAYSACMVEHEIADDQAYNRAKAAVVSRAFPIFTFDPRRGEKIKQRLDLSGNPDLNADWATDPKTGQVQDFAWFAREEGRFSKQFDKEGKPSETLLRSQAERLANWHRLQELAGLR